MKGNCIENFLMHSSPRHAERHSDSSDFETSQDIAVKQNLNDQVVPAKEKCYSFVNNESSKKNRNGMITRHIMCNNFHIYNTKPQYDREIPERDVVMYPTRQVKCDKNFGSTTNSNDNDNIRVNNNAKKRCQTFNFTDKSSARSPVKSASKIMPSLSNILRRPNKCKTQSAKDIVTNNYCEPPCREYYEKSRKNKHREAFHREHYSAQPVYNVEKEIRQCPQQKTMEHVELTVEKEPSEYINDYILSSGSEQEYFIPFKHKKIMKYIIRKIEKRIGKEYANVGTINHQYQQCPSKSELRVNTPCQVFTSSSCQTKTDFTDCKRQGMSSNSSEFWETILQKIKNHINKAEDTKSNRNCNETCPFSKTSSNTSINNPKKSSSSEVICKCLKSKPPSPNKINLKGSRTCQNDHDTLKQTLTDKYNGEILCIHNPPCILINGCLNLPQPKSANPQGIYFPVTQSKRSSFAQLCRKIKRSKPKGLDEAIQYEPPIDLQELLPEFRTEKIIQSMCSHNPPCEVVRRCRKPPYKPPLQTSCVHVPMCPNLPECYIEHRNTLEETICKHTPKCAELPLCTRKYIALTVKENAATQVKQKTKIRCRHQPPCIMLPRCLAQALCGDWYPGNAIPGCVHQPSCDMIPACCRKQAKELVSAQSQYPSTPCPIV